MIVRDEADHLRRCLNSIRGVVDEIVVVDTGSTDDTVEVAESFGAEVLHHRWSDNFAAARNVGLDRVSGDWVLYIDADEQLAPTTRAQVEHALADPEGRYLGKRLRLKIKPDFTPMWENRLWRNRAEIRFEGVIHEGHLHSMKPIMQAEGLEIGHADLLLEHSGYEGDLSAKHRRNLPMLTTQIGRDPDRTYLWTELARARNGLGDHDGSIAAWRHAVDLVRRNGVTHPSDCLAFVDLMFAWLDDHDACRDLVAEADALFEDNALVLWNGALAAMARHHHPEVIARIDRLLAVDREALARAALTISEHALTDWAHVTRGMARFQLGDYEGAAFDFAAAEALEPQVTEYRLKRQLAEARLSAPAPLGEPAPRGVGA